MKKVHTISFGLWMAYLFIFSFWIEKLGGVSGIPEKFHWLILFGIAAPSAILFFFGIWVESLWTRFGKEKHGYDANKFMSLVKTILRNKRDTETKNIALWLATRRDLERGLYEKGVWAIELLRNSKDKYDSGESSWVFKPYREKLESAFYQAVLVKMRSELLYLREKPSLENRTEVLGKLTKHIAQVFWSIGFKGDLSELLAPIFKDLSLDEFQALVLHLDKWTEIDFKNLPEAGRHEAISSCKSFSISLRDQASKLVPA